MSSPERELLKRCLRIVKLTDANILADEITELLAQPEQTEPELNQKSFRGLELSGDSYPPEYIEESPMYDMTIHDNPDALAWTRFFMETHPSCNVDDQTMFGWFANAMMAMLDHTCRSTALPKREPLSDDAIRAIVNQLPTDVDLDTGIEFCRIIEKHWSR
jgi:hypothetical protein